MNSPVFHVIYLGLDPLDGSLTHSSLDSEASSLWPGMILLGLLVQRPTIKGLDSKILLFTWSRPGTVRGPLLQRPIMCFQDEGQAWEPLAEVGFGITIWNYCWGSKLGLQIFIIQAE